VGLEPRLFLLGFQIQVVLQDVLSKQVLNARHLVLVVIGLLLEVVHNALQIQKCYFEFNAGK
jgi:hypothetical protein